MTLLRFFSYLAYLLSTVHSSALNLPVNLKTPSLAFVSPSNTSRVSFNVTGLNKTKVYCDSAMGFWDDTSSCEDALRQMPWGNRVLTWGKRELGRYDVPLPISYPSC